jgi:hypothetical protein
VGGIVDDSLRYQHRIPVYSAMLSRLSNLKTLQARLKVYTPARCVRTTEFRQGSTVRYGLAWTFGEHALEVPLPAGLGGGEALERARALLEEAGGGEVAGKGEKVRLTAAGECGFAIEVVAVSEGLRFACDFRYAGSKEDIAAARRRVQGIYDRAEGEVLRTSRRWKRKRKAEEGQP